MIRGILSATFGNRYSSSLDMMNNHYIMGDAKILNFHKESQNHPEVSVKQLVAISADISQN